MSSTADMPLFSNIRGNKFHTLWQHLPALKPFYFEFENTYVRATQRLAPTLGERQAVKAGGRSAVPFR